MVSCKGETALNKGSSFRCALRGSSIYLEHAKTGMPGCPKHLPMGLGRDAGSATVTDIYAHPAH